jgi:hypothetical protein
MTDYVTPVRVQADRDGLQAPPHGMRWSLNYDMSSGQLQGAVLVPNVSPEDRMERLFHILRDVFHQVIRQGSGVEALLTRIRHLEAIFQMPLIDEPGGLFPDDSRPPTSDLQRFLHERWRQHGQTGADT